MSITKKFIEGRKSFAKECGGKIKHNSIIEANKHASELRNKRKTFFSVYKCRWCNNLHVGRDKKNESI